MKKIYFLFVALLFAATGMLGQVTVTGDGAGSSPYPTLNAAIAAINAVGTLTQPTVLTCTSGETAPLGGYAITATGSAANTLTINGGGNIYIAAAAQASGVLTDAVFKLVGADFVTIQGFNIQENTANTTTAAGTNNMTEWGIALLEATGSTTNGCANNTIQNNTIALSRLYQNSFGIYGNVNHTPTAATTNVPTTSPSGANSFNKFYTNNISNVNYGIVLIGSSALTTVGAMDNGNDIGGNSTTTGNIITNSGGIGVAISGFVSVTGNNALIFTINQYNDNISYNNITSATGTTSNITLLGIFKNYSVATQPTGTVVSNINFNTIVLTNAPTASTPIIAIQNSGITPFLATASVNINGNTIKDGVLSGANASSGFVCITSGSLVGTLNINSNIITNNGTISTSSTSSAISGITNSGACNIVNINDNVINKFATRATSGSIAGINNSGSVITSLTINNNKLGDATNDFANFIVASSGGLNGINCTAGASTCNTTISGNDISRIVYTAAGSGAHNYILNSAGTFSQTISSNTFTNLNVNTTGSVTFIANNVALPAGGFVVANNNSIATAFNKTGAGGVVTLYLTSTTPSSASGTTKVMQGNIFSNITLTGATAMAGWMDVEGATGGGSTKTITNNIFTNWACGSSAVNCIQANYGGNNTAVSNNIISNITGTAAITPISIGSSSGGATQSVNSNQISSIVSSGTGGNVVGITGGSTSITTMLNIVSNKINNLSSTASSATVHGIVLSAGTSAFISKDTITNLTATGITSPVIRGIQVTSGSTTVNIDSCIVSNFTASGVGSVIMQGINVSGSTTVNTTRSNIYALNNASSGANAQTFGYNLSGGSGTYLVSNNFISDLTATGGTTSSAVVGIFLNTTVVTLKAYYNTINLGAAASVTGATNFGGCGVAFPVSTSTLLDLKSNIINVNITPNGTGVAAAVRRNGTGTANTAPGAGNFLADNNIYNIPSSTNNYLYVDATSTANAVNGFAVTGLTVNAGNNITNDAIFNTSCGLYKVFMGSREAATFNENNLVAGPFTATFVPTGSSYAESNGGVTSPATTNDFASIARTPLADVGALQFTATLIDAVGPAIAFTNLANTVCTTSPTLTAVITDATGVNVTSGLAPRLYYRKAGVTAEANVFGTYPADNTSAFNGWKYVEATGTAPNFSFAIDYSLLQTPMALGDTLTYFVLAQDIVATPNVGKNTVTFPTTFCPTSVVMPSMGAAPATASLGFRIVSIATLQPLTTSIVAGAVDNQVLRLDIPASPCYGNITQLNFTNNSTAVTDISAARVYYTTTTTFSTANLFGTATTTGAAFSVTGSQASALTGTNYFWLVYDVACAAPATTGNIADAGLTSVVTSSAGTLLPATSNPTGTRTITALVVAGGTTQASSAAINSGITSSPLIYFIVNGNNCGSLTQVRFNTTGTTAVADLLNAKCFVTTSLISAGTPGNPTTQFGSAIANPSGVLTFTGNLPLNTAATYYVYLTMDVTCTAPATAGNVIDGQAVDFVLTNNSVNTTYIPTSTNPTGTRAIAALTAPTIANDNLCTAIDITNTIYTPLTTEEKFTALNAGADGMPFRTCTNTISGATLECGEISPFSSVNYTMNHWGTPASSTLWYKFTPATSGKYMINGDPLTACTGAMGDSQLALWKQTGTTCGFSNLTLLASNDDSYTSNNQTLLSKLYGCNVSLVAATTYYVSVDGYGTATGTNALEIIKINDLTLVATQVPCTGGSLIVRANGGLIDIRSDLITNTASTITGYEFRLDGGAWIHNLVSSSTFDIGTFAAITAGTHTVDVRDRMGCITSLTVTIAAQPTLTIVDPAAVCSPATVNITPNTVQTVNTGNATTYYSTLALANAGGLNDITPTALAAGTYFIRAQNNLNCFNAKPVVVTVNPLPMLTIVDPATICSPATLDITAAAVQTTNNGTTTKYYSTLALANAGATADVTTPTAIAASGTYYIRSEFATGCFIVKPVVVTITNSNLTLAATTPGAAAVCQTIMVSGTAQTTYDACKLIATVNPTGASPVSGSVNTCTNLLTDPNTTGYIGSAVPRVYEITPVSNPLTSTGTITLYYDQADFDAYNTATGSTVFPSGPGGSTINICIYKIGSNGVGGLIPTPITTTWNATTMHWEVTFAVTGFSTFYCVDCSRPLSSSLVNLRGQATGATNTVYFSTLTEANNSKFIIERSTNGTAFAQVGEVATQAYNGNSNSAINYNFIDANPVLGKQFYRIKMVDRAGRATTSQAIIVRRGGTGNLEIVDVRPNPTTGIIYFNVLGTNTTLNLAVRDITGKTVLTKNFVQGSLSSLDLSKLAAGVYVIETVDANTKEKAVFKVVKQ